MTKDEALKLALEALREIAMAGMSPSPEMSEGHINAWRARQAWLFIGIAARALDPIKEALAQQEQEPWGACVYGRVFVGKLPAHARKFSEDEGVPIQWLYTTPPQRPWVGLTDVERDDLVAAGYDRTTMVVVDSLLKGKNI